jgi:hypothetical protein
VQYGQNRTLATGDVAGQSQHNGAAGSNQGKRRAQRGAAPTVPSYLALKSSQRA